MTSPATDHPAARTLPRARRWVRRVTACTTAGGVLLLGAPLVGGYVDPTGSGEDTVQTVDVGRLELAASKHRRTHPWRGHPGRRIRHYTVRPGDTATGLAVRFHAWTAELIRLNHLSPHATLYAGERIRIPVVVAAARKARRQKAARARSAHHRAAHHKARPATSHRPKPAAKPAKRAAHKQAAKPKRTPVAKPKPTPKPASASRPNRHGWRNADASRAQVRALIIRTANRYGVSPSLALAVAWQESGWQQRRISYAGAVGVMQVMPDTGKWMSAVLGRKLYLRRLGDNVTAGVALLKLLRNEVGPRKTMASYYQGLGSVQRYGMYVSTRHYVRSVVAIRHRLLHGWNPA